MNLLITTTAAALFFNTHSVMYKGCNCKCKHALKYNFKLKIKTQTYDSPFHLN